jgi:integrase
MRELQESIARPNIRKSRCVRVGECLYRRTDSNIYYFKGQIRGKEFTRSLGTTDRALAQRRAADFRREREHLDVGADKVTLAALCELYRASLLSKNFKTSTQAIKQRIINRILADWPSGKFAPIGEIRASHCDRWLARYSFGASARNEHVWLLKDLFTFAMRDRLLVTSPAEHLESTKRKDPLRLTPTPEQFAAIIRSVRDQQFNGHGASDSADFLEFMGLAGVGQAEASALTGGDMHFEANQISVLRRKTSKRFTIPIYPQLRPLLEKLCAGKVHNEKLFKLSDAKKALSAACKRLNFPSFSQRSLQRMFITQAIERGVDVKVIADWQGHRDGGVLILKTYSHVRAAHSQRMAKLMTSEKPDNVVPMKEGAA